MTMKTMHVGFDDTDSTRKGCTTYIAALLVEKLLKLGAGFIDYPNLIRLNPNVPWKTRGNGAICLRIKHDGRAEHRIKESVLTTVEEFSDLEAEGTDPGIVFLQKSKVPDEVKTFAQNAIGGIVTLKEALSLVKKFNAEALGFKDGRGIIGALAAIGETLQRDHTYEILAYRIPRNCGTKRSVDESSIFKMERLTAPYTFNNVDTEKNRVIVTPRGPDPILFGIRGENPKVLKKAFEVVQPLELVERWVIFRTNQGTDAHLRRVENLSQVEPYKSVIVRGAVSAGPRMIPTRHVIFAIRDETAQVDCAAYEPTGGLRKVAMNLAIEDFLEVYGGVRPGSKNRPLTINLEKLRILKLAPKLAHENPICTKCGKRLESMGKNQGFRCEKCGSRYRNLSKITVETERNMEKGMHVTATRSQRHLTKPLRRYGLEKHGKAPARLIKDWHFP